MLEAELLSVTSWESRGSSSLRAHLFGRVWGPCQGAESWSVSETFRHTCDKLSLQSQKHRLGVSEAMGVQEVERRSWYRVPFGLLQGHRGPGQHGPLRPGGGEAGAGGAQAGPQAAVLVEPGVLPLLLRLHGPDATRGELHHALPPGPRQELHTEAGHQRDHARAVLLLPGSAGAHLPADRLPALQAGASAAGPELRVRVASAALRLVRAAHAVHGVLLQHHHGGPHRLLLLHLLAGALRLLPAHGRLLAGLRSAGRLHQLRAGPAAGHDGQGPLLHAQLHLAGFPHLQSGPHALPEAPRAQPLLQPRSARAITSFAAGFVKIRWALWAELIIAVVTVLQAGLVFLMYRTSSIWLCYLAFVLFRGSYQFLVPIATFQIASSLSQELRALVFGVNTFLATVLKTIITLVVSDKRGLGLPVRSQFLIYFVYFLVLFVAYVLAALLTGLRHFRQGRRQPPPPARELTSPMQEPDAQDGLAPEDGVRAMGEQRQQPEAKA
ncbi:folate transporter 1 isoform X2 [Monodon monoceros]|uniref:folate transporter 1 isoform X2 n=1 Tax=Monodon monoceros TaxID=40151 RepID=UPI0010F4BFF6|nr:folate transporter 1 isoform X2 [Monodon monoceros]